MIFNRTEADVTEAKHIILEKVQKFLTLSNTEVETLEKGCLTINTLNRIENEQRRLNEVLNDMGYWNTEMTNKEWTISDVFDEQNFQRLLTNIDVLRNAFFTYSETPVTPNISYHFQAINEMEKILNDVGEIVTYTQANYKICGNFSCGEV